MGRWRKVLVVAAVVAAVGEALDSISVGWVGLVFAALFALGAVLVARGGRAGVILVGVLMLVEVVFWPFYPRESAADWIIQTAFLLLGLVGVVAACVTLWESRRAEAPPVHETG